MTEHTPTPWRIHTIYPAEVYATVDDKRHMVIDVCGAGSQDQDAINAAFIVKACNSHEALVKALKELVDYGGTTDRWDDARRYAKQVLASVGSPGET